MATPQQLSLVFEIDIKKPEKVTNPTKSLMMFVLEEAGFEGVWGLRDSRQIKKKGRERFKAIRLESRAGRLGIRVWCKPRGNDTCFEYSLVPPPEVDIQDAFSMLSRVSGVTLKIPESTSLPGAFRGRMLEVPPLSLAPKRVAEVEVVEEQATEGSPQVQAEFPSLVLDHQQVLSSQDSMDKALVAIAFVATDGYARKSDAFESLVVHLGIAGYVREREDVQSANSVVRSLTSSMKDLGGYIKRARTATQNGMCRSEIIGYKITEKGEGRLEEISQSYGREVEARLGDGWKSTAEPARNPSLDAPRNLEAVVGSEIASSVMPDAIARIKSLVASYDEADRQTSEYNGVIEGLDKDIIELEVEFNRITRSEETLDGQLKELQKELDGVRAKKEESEKELAKKRAERKDWERMRSPYHTEKLRIGSFLSGLEGKK